MAIVKSKEDYDKILKENHVVLVDFHAQWCGPCKMIAPKLDEFANEFTKIKVIKVDVDEVDDVAEAENVQAMPTFKVFVDGKEAEVIVGSNVDKLRAAMEKYNNA